MTKEEMLRRWAEINNESKQVWNDIEGHRAEEVRTIKVLHNSKEILERLDETFKQKTSLSDTDTKILMLATGLQLLRIYLLPKVSEKIPDEYRLDHNASIIKDMEKGEIAAFKNKHNGEWKSVGSKKYRSWQEIAFTIKVPYDATRHSGLGFNDRVMHGGQHRVKTLGHDPILGWIFGVSNIITDTITICPEYAEGEKSLRIPFIETYDVDMGSDFCWKDKTSTPKMFKNCFDSISEDKHRLYAAIFAQGLHLKSDKYTKMGLPVPFLSMLDSDKAYEIYKGGYDYLDYLYDTQILRRALKSAGQAMFINWAIGCIHKLFFNPQKDSSHELYNVRTRKIILLSNIIATSSDVIQTSIRAYNGDKDAIKNFDFGGFLVTLHRLITDTSVIMKVKEEFIDKEWEKVMESKNNILNI